MWVAVAVIAAGALTAGASVYSSRQTAKATKQAAQLQKQASDDALRSQQQDMNRANQREADTESLLEGNSSGDMSSTMLTGSGGLTLDDLILGRGTTQLGGRQ